MVFHTQRVGRREILRFLYFDGSPTDRPIPQTLVTPSPTTQGLSIWVFQHSGGRDFDLPRHSHYSGVISMVFQHSARAPPLAPQRATGTRQAHYHTAQSNTLTHTLPCISR